MNTTENNKIIAEFMGVDYNTQIAIICSDLYEQGYRSTEIINNLEPLIPYSFYHSDWNWLMEVVEKIENLGYTVNYYYGICEIVHSDSDFKRIIGVSDNYLRFEAYYDACIELIKLRKTL